MLILNYMFGSLIQAFILETQDTQLLPWSSWLEVMVKMGKLQLNIDWFGAGIVHIAAVAYWHLT